MSSPNPRVAPNPRTAAISILRLSAKQPSPQQHAPTTTLTVLNPRNDTLSTKRPRRTPCPHNLVDSRSVYSYKIRIRCHPWLFGCDPQKLFVHGNSETSCRPPSLTKPANNTKGLINRGTTCSRAAQQCFHRQHQVITAAEVFCCVLAIIIFIYAAVFQLVAVIVKQTPHVFVLKDFRSPSSLTCARFVSNCVRHMSTKHNSTTTKVRRFIRMMAATLSRQTFAHRGLPNLNLERLEVLVLLQLRLEPSDDSLVSV